MLQPDHRVRARRVVAGAAIAVLFLSIGLVIALIRFRLSPLYPRFNEVNSDFYVYQVIGNSWPYGLAPYRDAWDVKGPSFFALFGLFARIRPWSTMMPLAALAALAVVSLLLSYAIARLRLRPGPSVLSAAVSCALIYLGVGSVPSSFTVEEIAVPGVLLLLWLVGRWIGTCERVPAGWWVLLGGLLGALFWAKYQVIGPWAAILIAVIVLLVAGRLRGLVAARSLRRVVTLQLLGVFAVTAAVLPFYAGDLRAMARAYFFANAGGLGLTGELGRERTFAATMLADNTGVTLTILAVLVVLSAESVLAARARRVDRSGSGREAPVLLIAFVLSCWASVFGIQHTNNLFVPLAFTATAVPYLLAAAQAHRRVGARQARTALTGVVLGVLAIVACAGPIRQSVEDYSLLRGPKPLTCYRQPDSVRVVRHSGVAAAFAQAAGNAPILSVGTLSAARSMVDSRVPMRKPFEFVEPSRARVIGADRIQTRYLQDRTFDYVWIRIRGLRRHDDLEPQIAAAHYAAGPTASQQSVALVAHYVPVLVCNNEILLHAR